MYAWYVVYEGKTFHTCLICVIQKQQLFRTRTLPTAGRRNIHNIVETISPIDTIPKARWKISGMYRDTISIADMYTLYVHI